MDFNENALESRLSGRNIGRSIHFLQVADSTNEIAFRLALEGASEGTVVVADSQTKGKGRLNRVWQSPPKCNLYTSIILRPAIGPVNAPQITLMTGVVVAELISRYHPGDVTLKWPNDVQISGKKVCGILTEMRVSANQRVDFVIVGIGMNINMRRSDFDESFREEATSLMEEMGTEISRLDFTAILYGNFEKWYETWIAQGFKAVRDEWLKYAWMVGKRIQVSFRGDIRTGEVLGIDDCGALLLLDDGGTIRKIMAGDASILKE
jgi:BirA family transcriptional regulator, biotin operon repressor / biotin---[acetyl-CoA-carboxylase] ligase